MPTNLTIGRQRTAPWVGCGTSGSWTDVREALRDSGLLYDVEQVKAYDDHGNEVPGILVNRKLNTNEIMGTTSDQYGVIQNLDGFGMIDPFIRAGGVIEHAGMTEQGMCFMVMRMQSASFGFAGDDFDLFVCAMNSFNTRFPMAIIITPVRVICQNMFKNLMKRGDTMLNIKHGRLANTRMLSATQAASNIINFENDFCKELSECAMAKRSVNNVESFIESMFPYGDPNRPQFNTSKEKVDILRDRFMNDYYLAADNANYVGTRLGILNAYFDWISHSEPTRMMQGRYQDRRFSNLMSGTAIKSKLIKEA